MKKLNFKHGIYSIAFVVLITVANISTSTSTLLFWHEPKCPKELLK